MLVARIPSLNHIGYHIVRHGRDDMCPGSRRLAASAQDQIPENTVDVFSDGGVLEVVLFEAACNN